MECNDRRVPGAKLGPGSPKGGGEAGDGAGATSERGVRPMIKKNLQVTQPTVEEPWVGDRIPGAVGAITDWIIAYSIRPSPMMALGVALAIVGTVKRRPRRAAGPSNRQGERNGV